MRKIKLFFVVFFILLSLAMLIAIRSLPSRVRTAGSGTSSGIDFAVTDVSGGGFQAGGLFPQPSELRSLEIARETLFRTGEGTSAEFMFGGVFFLALPGSQFIFTPQTRQLFLQKGEFFWNQAAPWAPVSVSLSKPANIMSLSGAGRIRVRDAEVEIWNYAGALQFNIESSRFQMAPLQYNLISGRHRAQVSAVALAPESISPEEATVRLEMQSGSQVQFNWKNVAGVTQYLLRFYPSRLKEKVMESRVIGDSSALIDLSSYLDRDRIYWDVCAFDPASGLEAAPSKLGVIRFSGLRPMARKETAPPHLAIHSITVSGNVVLIRGSASPDAQMTIDGQPVKIDSEGKFIHTIIYSTMGIKEIAFVATSPGGLSTTQKKQISVYDESLS